MSMSNSSPVNRHASTLGAQNSEPVTSSINNSYSRPVFHSRPGPGGVTLLPSRFEVCETNALIDLIAAMLERLIAHNDQIPLAPSSLTRFHSRAPPPISVRDYLVRVATYTNSDPCCLLILLCYVDKVCERIPGFTISSLTVHRFIIAAIAISSKALSDSFSLNGRYARIGGVSLVEMNLLEKEFLAAVEWRLTRSRTVLSQYYMSLVESHPNYQLSEDSEEERRVYKSGYSHTEPDTRKIKATDHMQLDSEPNISNIALSDLYRPLHQNQDHSSSSSRPAHLSINNNNVLVSSSTSSLSSPLSPTIVSITSNPSNNNNNANNMRNNSSFVKDRVQDHDFSPKVRFKRKKSVSVSPVVEEFASSKSSPSSLSSKSRAPSLTSLTSQGQSLSRTIQQQHSQMPTSSAQPSSVVPLSTSNSSKSPSLSPSATQLRRCSTSSSLSPRMSRKTSADHHHSNSITIRYSPKTHPAAGSAANIGHVAVS